MRLDWYIFILLAGAIAIAGVCAALGAKLWVPLSLGLMWGWVLAVLVITRD